jgi:hypothetical protein
VWTTWLRKDHDTVLCPASFARHGSCRSQFLISDNTRASAKDIWSLLRVSQDSKWSRACPRPGKIKCQNWVLECCSNCFETG